jgi:anti-sigma regulatory factor (Ser/Thr protein kinase)
MSGLARDVPFAGLHVTVPAEACYLRELRHLVRTFADAAGTPEERVADMLIAANEACANVVIHAYDNGPGPLHLRAWQTSGGVTIEVSDNGTPVAKPVEGRIGGRGLQVIRSVCDDVDIEGPGEYGTRLEMSFCLP